MNRIGKIVFLAILIVFGLGCQPTTEVVFMNSTSQAVRIVVKTENKAPFNKLVLFNLTVKTKGKFSKFNRFFNSPNYPFYIYVFDKNGLELFSKTINSKKDIKHPQPRERKRNRAIIDVTNKGICTAYTYDFKCQTPQQS